MLPSIIALTVVCLIFSLGDIISSLTKAVFSTMFVSAVLLLVGFWIGLPKDILSVSGLTAIGAVLMSYLVTHLGTLMDFQELVRQWKTVLIALSAVIGIGIVLYFIGAPIIGSKFAIAAAPPIAGGTVAAIIMGAAAEKQGLTEIVVYTSLLVCIQGFLGYPVASFCLRLEAKRLLAELADKKGTGEMNSESTEEQIQPRKRLIPPLPKELANSTAIMLAKLGIVTIIAYKIAELSGGRINAMVVCLIVGVIFKEIGFLEGDILTKANCFGFAMTALLAVIYAGLVNATPDMILQLLFPLVAALLIGLVGIIAGSVLMGKLLKIPVNIAISIGSTCLIGFPGTMIISTEVSNAMGKTDEERKYILDYILPKMLIAGFVTVTISSVILAGIMEKFL